MMDRPQSHLSSSGGESASASSLPSSSQAADPLASAASSLSQTEPSADLTQTSVPELGAASGSHSVAQESSIRMYVESQDGSLTDDDTSELSVRDKVNRGTLTEREDSRRPKCKYCLQRLSKLRKLEKMKTLKSGESSSSHEHHIYSPMQPKKDKSCQTSASLFEKAEMTQKEMRSLAMILGFRDGKPSRTETFCKCVLHGKERDCRCGEEDKYFEWYWDIQNRGMATNIQERGRLVVFHKDYSCGTTAIRGTQPMEKDQHFWEIKMTTPVYGTDMMVGVGTSNVELNKFHNTFCSMLGYDMDSWGISYDGRVQHGGRKRDYCSRFGQGAIIGVHLDMWHGTLAFFKNRQCLGVAFRGLRGRTLYPMACSTAARSGMRVISSRSFPTSLQFLCCQRLRQFVPAHLSVLDTLAMPPGLRAFLANNMTWLLHVPTMSPPKPRTGYICHICMPLKGVLEGCTDDEVDSSDEDRIDHVHDMANLWNSDEDSDDDDDDSDDISDRTPSGTLPSRLMTSLLNSGSSASSDAGRAVVSHRSVFGVKKTRLEQDCSLPFVEEGESYTDDEEEEDESMKTAEESSSGPQRETVSSELMVEEEEEEDASGPKVFKKLGKRKRSN